MPRPERAASWLIMTTAAGRVVTMDMGNYMGSRGPRGIDYRRKVR
jgi:hypothetical protein